MSEKRELPHELSPVFFRPEVLAKYKADSEKYRLDEHNISCRDTWSLQTYDINEAGQVHTYLVYLGRLPYEEQMYWKSFNEPPNGTISRRAFLADFQGSWDHPYDPLLNIKDWARNSKPTERPWWTLTGEHLLEQTRYVITASPDEWANELLHLDQLLIEGLRDAWLKKKAEDLSLVLKEKLGSIKILRECIAGIGWQDTEVQNTIAPLEELHFLRTKLKGHAVSEKTLSELRERTLSEYGSFSAHFKTLCERCDNSMRLIARSFDQ
jgi:hypothetical protein